MTDPFELTPAQRAVLTWGLTNVESLEPSAAELDELVPWAAEERLLGLLWTVRNELGHPRCELLDQALLDALRQTLAAEAEGLRAANLLRRCGIDMCFHKGVAVAHLDYGDPSHRLFVDADIFVPRVDFPRALTVLEASGYERETQPIIGRWEARFGRAMMMCSPNGIEVDVHAMIAPGYFGVRLDHTRLVQREPNLVLAGESWRSFSDAGRLIGSCYAIELSRGPKCRLFRDVLIGSQQPGAMTAAYDLASASDGGPVIARVGASLQENFGVLAEPLPDVVATGTQRRAIRLASLAARRGWRYDAASEVTGLSWFDKMRYCVAMVPLVARAVTGR